MYIIYQPMLGTGVFYMDEWRPIISMGPSACQWFVPGTIDPEDD